MITAREQASVSNNMHNFVYAQRRIDTKLMAGMSLQRRSVVYLMNNIEHKILIPVKAHSFLHDLAPSRICQVASKDLVLVPRVGAIRSGAECKASSCSSKRQKAPCAGGTTALVTMLR